MGQGPANENIQIGLLAHSLFMSWLSAALDPGLVPCLLNRGPGAGRAASGHAGGETPWFWAWWLVAGQGACKSMLPVGNAEHLNLGICLFQFRRAGEMMLKRPRRHVFLVFSILLVEK